MTTYEASASLASPAGTVVHFLAGVVADHSIGFQRAGVTVLALTATVVLMVAAVHCGLGVRRHAGLAQRRGAEPQAQCGRRKAGGELGALSKTQAEDPPPMAERSATVTSSTSGIHWWIFELGERPGILPGFLAV